MGEWGKNKYRIQESVVRMNFLIRYFNYKLETLDLKLPTGWLVNMDIRAGFGASDL
jgi:hypothetical protein